MSKRVDLIDDYVVDIDEKNMCLKNNIRIKVNAKGEEVESYNEHGFFTNERSLFKKLHTLLKLEKLQPKNSLEDWFKASRDTDMQIDRLCRLLEGTFKECSLGFGSENDDAEDEEE